MVSWRFRLPPTRAKKSRKSYVLRKRLGGGVGAGVGAPGAGQNEGREAWARSRFRSRLFPVVIRNGMLFMLFVAYNN
jgi:hypothetical protein